jgi:hypothetical protein
MLVWFWATTAAAFLPTPMQVMSLPSQMLEAQQTVIAAASRPLTAPIMSSIMTLGWVDEEDAPIF